MYNKDDCSSHIGAVIKKEEDVNQIIIISLPDVPLTKSESYSDPLQLLETEYHSDDDPTKVVIAEKQEDDIAAQKQVQVYTCADSDKAAAEKENVEDLLSSDDEDITSFDGITLKRSDVDSLKGTNYISDNVIGFYFSCLASHYQFDDVYLVSPSVSYMLATLEPEESLEAIVSPLNLREKRLLVFALNDAKGNEDEGLHWSVLVYHKERDAFYHHDSMRGMHYGCARRFYRKLRKLLGPSDGMMMRCGKKRKKKMNFGYKVLSYSFFEEDEDERFYSRYTPQQSNSTDCGLYVMELARVICRWYARESRDEHGLWVSDFTDIDTVSVEAEMRDKVQQLIQAARNGKYPLLP